MYTDWEHIMLDTSAIITYLYGVINQKNERAVFAKRVIDDLISKKNNQSKNRQFYVSSITIAELYNKSGDVTKADKIVKMLNVKALTFMPFDNDIAEYMTGKYHSILGTDKLKDIARELNFPEHDLLLGRQWIEKDVMILGTADYLNCDAVLTMDKKTMLPIANKLDIYCAVLEKENFNYGDSHVFEYQLGFNNATV